jgi:hypothetical protein
VAFRVNGKKVKPSELPEIRSRSKWRIMASRAVVLASLSYLSQTELISFFCF